MATWTDKTMFSYSIDSQSCRRTRNRVTWECRDRTEGADISQDTRKSTIYIDQRSDKYISFTWRSWPFKSLTNSLFMSFLIR